MRFALVGTHEDGLGMARALVVSGRHQLLYVVDRDLSTPPPWAAGAKVQGDLEEVLADPAVEAVIVASPLGRRFAHLRRVLQSERVALCLQPTDTRPEGAYEADMLQQDTKQVAVPLQPEAFHPALRGLKALLPSLGELRVIEVERWSRGEILPGLETPEGRLCVPGWEILRSLGGDIAELAAVVPGEELAGGTPVVISGRFERGGLFSMTLLPGQREERLRVRAVGGAGEAEWLMPLGVPGPAFLSWPGANGATREQAWEAWDPWPAMVEVVEKSLAGADPEVSWQDAIRCHELDEAVRRGVERRKVYQLEYPEASEEVTFKSTMTLVGCALVWGVILLVILSRWQPWIGWGIGPLLGIFLLMQLLRWIIPPREQTKEPRS
jgi:hypothetical protein